MSMRGSASSASTSSASIPQAPAFARAASMFTSAQANILMPGKVAAPFR